MSRDKAGDYQCVTTSSGGLSRRRMAVASLPASLALAALGDFPPAGRDDAVEAFVGNDVVIDCTVPDSNPPAFVQFYKASEPLTYLAFQVDVKRSIKVLDSLHMIMLASRNPSPNISMQRALLFTKVWST